LPECIGRVLHKYDIRVERRIRIPLENTQKRRDDVPPRREVVVAILRHAFIRKPSSFSPLSLGGILVLPKTGLAIDLVHVITIGPLVCLDPSSFMRHQAAGCGSKDH
jgi:hypothetical protein